MLRDYRWRCHIQSGGVSVCQQVCYTNRHSYSNPLSYTLTERSLHQRYRRRDRIWWRWRCTATESHSRGSCLGRTSCEAWRNWWERRDRIRWSRALRPTATTCLQPRQYSLISIDQLMIQHGAGVAIDRPTAQCSTSNSPVPRSEFETWTLCVQQHHNNTIQFSFGHC